MKSSCYFTPSKKIIFNRAGKHAQNCIHESWGIPSQNIKIWRKSGRSGGLARPSLEWWQMILISELTENFYAPVVWEVVLCESSKFSKYVVSTRVYQSIENDQRNWTWLYSWFSFWSSNVIWISWILFLCARSERPFLIRMAKIPVIEIIDVIAMKKGQNMTGNSRV